MNSYIKILMGDCNVLHRLYRRSREIDNLAGHEFHVAYVVCDTYHDEIINSTLKGSGRLYFYLARFLIERISWFGADRMDTVDLVFANRSNMLYCDLKEYLALLLNDRTCQIKPGVIDINRISCQNVGQLKLLQVSDICNSSCKRYKKTGPETQGTHTSKRAAGY
jgi:hypothetical protein